MKEYRNRIADMMLHQKLESSGAVVSRLLKRCPKGTVTGIDYSPVSVKKSTEVNAAIGFLPTDS